MHCCLLLYFCCYIFFVSFFASFYPSCFSRFAFFLILLLLFFLFFFCFLFFFWFLCFFSFFFFSFSFLFSCSFFFPLLVLPLVSSPLSSLASSLPFPSHSINLYFWLTQQWLAPAAASETLSLQPLRPPLETLQLLLLVSLWLAASDCGKEILIKIKRLQKLIKS